MPNKPAYIDKFCATCLSPFKAMVKHHKKGIGNYCSPMCRGIAHRGFKMPVVLKGKDNPNWKGGLSAVESARIYQSKNPKKIKAHKKVQKAVASGKLKKQPCEVCGERMSQGHHCDYDKPLDVMWLCQVHHSEWHRINGEGKNAT